ncbi:hypothetical protein AAF134_11405 [Synechococcus lacustris Tous-12m]
MWVINTAARGWQVPETQLLTDRQLRSWLRCHRKAWLDRHGNPNEKSGIPIGLCS